MEGMEGMEGMGAPGSLAGNSHNGQAGLRAACHKGGCKRDGAPACY